MESSLTDPLLYLLFANSTQNALFKCITALMPLPLPAKLQATSIPCVHARYVFISTTWSQSLTSMVLTEL